MTLVAHNITANRKTGEEITVTVPIYSSEPGVITASASGCTFPDGATATIPGTRTYHMDGFNGDYLLAPNVGQTRSDVTWFFEVDWSRIPNLEASTPTTLYARCPLFGSIKSSWAGNRYNWYFDASRQLNSSIISYCDSIDSLSSPGGTFSSPNGSRLEQGIVKYVLTKDAAGNTNFYRASSAIVTNSTRASSGTMGVNEVLVVWATGLKSASKILRVADLAEIDAYFASGTVPGTNQDFSFLGGHEISRDNQKIYDSSVNLYDLYSFTDASIDGWRAPGITQRTTDDPGNPVIPASSIRVTIPAGVASPVTLSLSRPRAGVPSRASEAEKYETTTGTITLVDVPTEIYAGPAQHVRSRF